MEEPCPAPDAPAVEPKPPSSPDSPRSASPPCCCAANLARLCAALEMQNERLAALIGLLVTIEPTEPEPDDPDAPPTHDLAGRPIEVR